MPAGPHPAGARPIPWRHGPPARVEVRREGDRTTVVIHASVKPVVKGIFAAWLGGWAVGELVALRLATAASESLLPFFHGVTLLFLAGWTVMGAVVAHGLLWCYQGTEELSSDGRELTFRRQVAGLGRTRRFPLASVRGPSIRFDGWVTSLDQVAPDTLVRLAFETRWSVHRLSASLRFEDARRVVAALAGGPASRAPARPAGAPPPLPR